MHNHLSLASFAVKAEKDAKIVGGAMLLMLATAVPANAFTEAQRKAFLPGNRSEIIAESLHKYLLAQGKQDCTKRQSTRSI